MRTLAERDVAAALARALSRNGHPRDPEPLEAVWLVGLVLGLGFYLWAAGRAVKPWWVW